MSGSRRWFVVLSVVLCVTAILGVWVGAEHFSPVDVLTLLAGAGDDGRRMILTELRLPRVVAAVAVGAGLAVAGCLLQSAFLNPLCESYTLGISSAAAVGVVMGFLLALPYGRMVTSAAGAVAGMLCAWLMSVFSRRTVDIGFVLAGIVMNFVCSALMVLLTVFIDPYRLQFVLLWMLGGFAALDAWAGYVGAALIAAALGAAFARARRLDALVLGDEKAVSLGLHPDAERLTAVAIAVGIATVCVALAGVVAFVGIIVPNITRVLSGQRHHTWMAMSALLGASLLSLADAAARTLLYPVEIPISAFTGVIGGVVFLAHLARSHRRTGA